MPTWLGRAEVLVVGPHCAGQGGHVRRGVRVTVRHELQ